MPTKDGFTPDHPLPRFLSEYADEPEQPGIDIAWDRPVISSRILKTGILVVTATVIAILSVENPVALFAKVTASLVDLSAFQPGTGQSTPAIQSTAGAEALQPTARDAPTRDKIAAASESADQSQTEISQLPPEALLKQFQAWAAEEDVRPQVVPVQPVQDAPAQVVPTHPLQDAPAQVVENAQPVRPMQRHRRVRPVQNARAEIRRVQNARAEIRRVQNARVQVRPAQDTRALDPSAQNAQAPSLLQSLGLRD